MGVTFFIQIVIDQSLKLSKIQFEIKSKQSFNLFCLSQKYPVFETSKNTEKVSQK